MSTPLQSPAVYNAGTGYPVQEVKDGNLTLVDVYGTGAYGILTAAKIVGQMVGAVLPSTDTTGMEDTAAIFNAISQLPTQLDANTNQTYTVGSIVLAPGDYYITGIIKPPKVNLLGAGPGTVLHVVGNGVTGIYSHHPATQPGNLQRYATSGTIADLTVDGSLTTGASIGIDIGDGWGHHLSHVWVQHFTGPSLAAPAAPTLTPLNTGGTVAAGTYQASVTYVSANGETLASVTASVTTTTGTSQIEVGPPAQVAGAVGWYLYLTQVGGSSQTRQQAAGMYSPFGINYFVTAPPTNTGMAPPGWNSTGAIGLSICNRQFWTEKFKSDHVTVQDCTTCVQIWLANNATSTMYSDHEFYIYTNVGQTGLLYMGVIHNGSLKLRGNGTKGGNGFIVLADDFGGNGPALINIGVDIDTENDGSGTNVPSIVFANTDCTWISTGRMRFTSGQGNPQPGQFAHRGFISEANTSLQAVTAPAAQPASNTSYTNTQNDAVVYVSGGTVTSIHVNGTLTGLTSGPVFLPSGGSMNIVWTVQPSWAWVSAV